ncbi:siphovirus Gp157 family protein [Chelatococcus reniformis]|uniref:Siphovirus Gp157 family protein n=1 Tax=Chelatococcus reniformis TaxID=1494448 RepID=A0A916UFF8_9HYPH|nr:siphovirus Gp157 family protein [Chelatococcus reniformis]GGC70460.1 hypothetical protein GCM10010994_31240 [Chelatococcus reniformis]
MNAPDRAPRDAAASLLREMEAASVLRSQIADLAAGDPEFLRDTIEGETSLHEQIALLVASVEEDKAMAEASSELAARIKARSDRLAERAEMKRVLISSAMEIGELKRLPTPAGTVTRKEVAPKVVVTEEADIPTRFFKAAKPTLSKKDLLDALKARRTAQQEAAKIQNQEERAAALVAIDRDHPDVPGATLSNGSFTIQISGR